MEITQTQTIESLVDIKAFSETRALADLANDLFLLLDEEIKQPDKRQVQAMYLIAEAWQYLYAASINLMPFDPTNPDNAGDSLEGCDD
jgi:hypothetical protein